EEAYTYKNEVPADADIRTLALSAFDIGVTDSQLKVIKHIDMGKVCFLVSASRWGDSKAHFLRPLLWSDRIIVSSTNVHEQFSESLASQGVDCISLGSVLTATKPTTLQISSLVGARSCFMTPELLQSRLFERLLYSEEWRQLLLAAVFDKAHNMTI
ncbi:hypothetical protein BG000_001901, partial [Podila horticola]